MADEEHTVTLRIDITTFGNEKVYPRVARALLRILTLNFPDRFKMTMCFGKKEIPVIYDRDLTGHHIQGRKGEPTLVIGKV